MTNKVEIIEPAVVSPIPVPSPLLNNVLLGAGVGFVLALIIMLLYEYFDNTVKSAEEVVQAANMPLLGAIARYKSLRGTGAERLAVQALPESRAAENYRMLSTRLYFSGDAALHSMLVSSPQFSGETGEVASNLDVALAQTRRKVVLVDANLRSPVVAQLFGLENGRGLSEALAPNAPAPKLTTIDWVSNLSILPAGSVSANPFELLGSPRMVQLIKQLESQADVVIIAAAPLLSSADSLVLASHVSGVVVVAQNAKTRRDALGDAIESLRSVGAYIVGTVLSSSSRGGVSLASVRPSSFRTIDQVDGVRTLDDAEAKKNLSTV